MEEKVWIWSAGTGGRYGWSLVRLVLRFDEKETSVDAEIISDIYHMEEEYEQRLSEESENERSS